ncbi:NADH dehydrogenase [ubiquinone] 1 alpha subcomplex subunit 13 [Sitophilus oryzae]|uniref:NADH dehydrogenase [ubiquinone] 1 alpha subcomplex subunit 13 n=1 Tax=Sitophilus oryzae TaxID=7048 RepID=A0A6J2YBQ9_SITOR|nr:NADH dehydrogenase [ubiquinone] 1 alpha subcomplex subunit 13 [Sitophilus oryzae]
MTEFKQDMPPQGGYKPISFKRVPPLSYFNGYAIFGIYIGVTAGSAFLYHLNVKAVARRELETKGASLAIYPLLLAERDRSYLKQLRRNREEEADLMKNVPGWKVGTWYGEPIYKTQKDDTWNDPSYYEYFVHAKYSDVAKRGDISFIS